MEPNTVVYRNDNKVNAFKDKLIPAKLLSRFRLQPLKVQETMMSSVWTTTTAKKQTNKQKPTERVKYNIKGPEVGVRGVLMYDVSIINDGLHQLRNNYFSD